MKRIGSLERKYVLKVLDNQFRSSSGNQMTKLLEEAFAKKIGMKHAIAFVNGTATLHAALVAAGIGPGDEVIVPPLTMASTAFGVIHANAIPVFADIDPDTFTISPENIRKKITERTKAIIPVALYGLSPDMDEIMKIAAEHNLTVVEDDAQCLLGYYKARIVGSLGHLSSFSFQSSKHITSGEGGMVVTNSEKLADKVRRFNSLGYAGVSATKGKITRDDIQDPLYDRHMEVGFNYRLSELCSAVVLAQVERLEDMVEKRIESAYFYSEAVKDCAWLKPQKVPAGYKHSYWTYVLKLSEDAGVNWYDFRKKYIELGGDGIYSAWKLTYLEPVFQKKVFYQKGCPLTCPYYKGKVQEYQSGLCPNAEAVQPKLFQFKTNYLDKGVARRKAQALAKTIAYFK
ncbi:MAG: DegT/DnrJ/EryC1/StrS family aminotransferase [Candidatus Omnitrophica bacterium]|nr:DegT/DnrJ/EryC1/StrS family aminotransferase [Candidatus Omnitrophota bacterium]